MGKQIADQTWDKIIVIINDHSIYEMHIDNELLIYIALTRENILSTRERDYYGESNWSIK